MPGVRALPATDLFAKNTGHWHPILYDSDDYLRRLELYLVQSYIMNRVFRKHVY